MRITHPDNRSNHTATHRAKAREQKAAPVVVFKDAAAVRGGRIIWSQGTFAIPAGSICAIVGPNGAGKTTLLDVELGMLPAASGSVTVLGRPAGATNKRIGYVPQDYASDIDANITAEQSVGLGLNGARFGLHRLTESDRRKIADALALAGIGDAGKLRLSEMSGGMRQRVAIAQALVSQPELLLLDEPLANLDPAGQHGLVATLAHLNAQLNMSIQIVAHDINVLLPILTGAIYLLDGHPHYSEISNVMDSKLLTHLYGTKVEVLKTPQGDMFVRPNAEVEPIKRHRHLHTTAEAAHFHESDADLPIDEALAGTDRGTADSGAAFTAASDKASDKDSE